METSTFHKINCASPASGVYHIIFSLPGVLSFSCLLSIVNFPYTSDWLTHLLRLSFLENVYRKCKIINTFSGPPELPPCANSVIVLLDFNNQNSLSAYYLNEVNALHYGIKHKWDILGVIDKFSWVNKLIVIKDFVLLVKLISEEVVENIHPVSVPRGTFSSNHYQASL